MKICFRLWSLGLGLMAVGPVFGEQPLPWRADTAESVMIKANHLIREKAGLPNEVTQSAAEHLPADTSADTLVLEPFVVTGKKALAIPPPLHETRVQEFFRTGTIWEKIGHKFTTKFGVSGDKGIFFRFSW